MASWIHLRVVGVTFEGRQDMLRELATKGYDHKAKIVREPDNKFDSNAVAVHVGDMQIGYLERGWWKTFVRGGPTRNRIIKVIKTEEEVAVRLLIPQSGEGTYGARVVIGT